MFTREGGLVIVTLFTFVNLGPYKASNEAMFKFERLSPSQPITDNPIRDHYRIQ